MFTYCQTRKSTEGRTERAVLGKAGVVSYPPRREGCAGLKIFFEEL
jgi:hypothetical protein